jgi:hypothetical protein
MAPSPTNNSNNKHRRVRTTLQTMMLGAGGDDDDEDNNNDNFEMIPDGNSQPVGVSQTAPARWFSKSAKHDDNEQQQQQQSSSLVYEPFDDDHQHDNHQHHHRYNGRFRQTHSAPAAAAAALVVDPSTLSQEERLQQDCSFFYRNFEHGQQQHERISTFRTLLADSFRTSSSLFLPYQYRDMVVPVLSPPVLSHYRSKYQQLNQELPTTTTKKKKKNNNREHYGHYHHHDLHLSTTDTTTDNSSSNHHHQHHHSSVQYSSLLYQHKGRILLRLPQDHVQLIMDSDLEVGRLSVKQWRKEEEEEEEQQEQLDSNNNKQQQQQQRPPLYYVLTVPEDLYRQVVGDMSHAVMHPFCNVGRCCNDHEHVDIGVAVCIMAIVMGLLLIIGAIYGDS